jgi:hypothetical protein
LPGQFRMHVQRPGEVHIQVPVKRTLVVADSNYSFCAQPKCYLKPNTHLKKEWSVAAKAGPRSTQVDGTCVANWWACTASGVVPTGCWCCAGETPPSLGDVMKWQQTHQVRCTQMDVPWAASAKRQFEGLYN